MTRQPIRMMMFFLTFRGLLGRILADFRTSMQATQEFPAEAAVAPQAPEPVAMTVAAAPAPPPREIGGPTGPEPTRFGDWERKGRCIDF
jgi:hypothetical protein